jgi:hypothetical protein
MEHAEDKAFKKICISHSGLDFSTHTTQYQYI